ncbi:MAG: nitroreductase family protein [Promethearchaeota archaeon]
MDLMKAIKNRRSIRQYLTREVEEEKIRTILEAAQWAPSASNRQPWHFIVVRDSETRKKLGELHPHGFWMKDSPVVIVVLGDPNKHPNYYLCDPHQAVQNLLLAAYSQGLSTCWMGVRGKDIEAEFKKLLGVPKDLRVICTISVGYSEQTRSSSRLSFDDIVSWERYGEK